VIIEELAYGDYANTNWFSMPEVLGPSFLEVASPKLVGLALVPYLTGSSWWCQGFSEPEAGSDLASLRTRAEKQGGTFLINGQKVWTTMAHLADRCVLLARTGTAESRHRGITAFLIDMDSPGISVRPLHNSTGRAEFCEVFFEDVIVPEERVIGEIGGAWSFAMKILACERATVFWGDITALYRKFDDLIPLAADGTRSADGAIGAMFQLLHSLRARSAGTQRQAATGTLDSSATSVDKLLRTTCDQLLYDLARDFLGYRIAYSADRVDVRWRHEYLESRAASIYGGSSEIQRNIIAERLLGLPRG
jgi:alkylation response protein AidB-like acyl-CoA dehydrogenase